MNPPGRPGGEGRRQPSPGGPVPAAPLPDAAALVDGAALPVGLDAAARHALAWALKQHCYAAWSSEPPRAARAAEVLQRLAASAPDDAELAALAHWTSAVGALTQGRMADAVAALDRAAADWTALGRPLEAAQTQVPKVMALSMLGRHEEAAACGAAAQAAFRQQGDLAAASKVSLNLGSLHLRRDDHAAAAHHYRQAAVLFARVGDVEHSVMADIGLGDALTAQGDFDESGRIYARAHMRAGHHELPLLQAMAAESMALLDLARGAYDAALAGLEHSRRVYARLKLPQHGAIAEKQLADAYLELRLLPEALALYDQALATMAALDMPDDRAWTSLQRGRTLAAMARPDAAAAALADAAAQFAVQDTGPGRAAVALAQAELAWVVGDDTAAQASARSAERVFTEAGLPEGALRAAVLRAGATLRGGDAVAARQQFEQALQRAVPLQARSLQMRAQAGVGAAALAQGDREGAQAALQAAVDQFEAQWRVLPGDELRGAFLADHLAPYQGLLALSLQDLDEQPDAAHAVQVLRRLDAVRARALAERLRQGPASGDDEATEALRTRLQWLHRRVQRQADEGQPSALLVDVLRSTEQALLEQARRQRLAGPNGADAAPGAAPDELDVPALQAGLAQGDALVVYGRHGDELLACVVRRDRVQVCRHLAHWPDVQAAWRLARFQLDALRHGAKPLLGRLDLLVQRAQSRLQALHTLVWEPLSTLLTDVRRLLVVPTDGLTGLPFAALHDGLTCLAQRHLLAEAPSVRVALRGLQRPPVAAHRVLALGESSRLPHAGHEARAVAAQFAEGRVFAGDEATLAHLQQHAAEADVLHLACHAQFRRDNPMFSALHLHDGPLTAERAETLGLRAGVVVLSACETGLAGLAGGDEQVGLVRAFLVAGASRVLASLWPVDDAVTATFMARFYRELRQGRSPAEALGEAQTELMVRHPHPAFWSGFVIYGGW